MKLPIFSKPIVSLAPMDGVTDRAYRQIVRKLNPDVILYSEFTSVNGIEHSDFVRDRLTYKKEELPYFIQIFGNDPVLFAKITSEFSDSGITGVDINMGCPARKIVGANTGSSLIKDKDLACRIVDACVKATDLPVTVKTRIGWDHSDDLVDFVSGLVDAGAQMVTIHGRTSRQMYKGFADWNPIYNLKKNISVPVVGNGDVKGKDDGLERMKNLDGYMVGRASVGNPWVFWSDEDRAKVTLKEKIDVMLEHFQLIRTFKEERRAVIEFRKHISGYIMGFDDAKQHRIRLMECQTEKDLITVSRSIC